MKRTDCSEYNPCVFRMYKVRGELHVKMAKSTAQLGESVF